MSNISTGFFCMQDANAIIAIGNLAAAKAFASSKIESFVAQYPNTKINNINKANLIISKSRSINELAAGIVSLILAHPSEGLKVIK